MKRGSILGGRFRLGEQIARGGMGTVHRARDLSRDVDVAVKLLTGPRAEAFERFSREAAVLASLDHPAIVRYVAHGRGGDDMPWLAMEWLDGEPLSRRLEAGPLDVKDAVLLVRRVADAVGTAHARGIVHRDLKPSNLFLVDGAPAGVVVLDFGIARRLHPDDDVTEPGAVVGTWSYMAPEQALARADIDSRVDVFALGCVLFECLTGQKAFASGQRTAVLAKILLEDPRAPSELMSHVPSALDDLVLGMLAKAADERLSDGAEVARALRELGDVSALPPRPRSTLPPSLGNAEKRVITVLLANGFRDSDATVSETGTGPMEAPVRDALVGLVSRLCFLANGSLLGIVSGNDLPVDAALCAARAALALSRVAPDASVAIATGFAVVSERQPVGAVIDRAVTLLRNTAAAEVRLDATTEQLLAARCELQPDDRGALLTAERDAIDVSRRLLGRSTAFVGRDAELSALLATACHALDEGEAAIGVVLGPPGSGKSRLGVELVSRLTRERDDVLVLFARGDSVRAGSPFLLVSSLLARYADIGVGDDIATRRQKLGRRLAGVMADPTASSRAAAFLYELIGAPLENDARVTAARADPRLMFDAIEHSLNDWLAAELNVQPVVVALDDLQWGDAPSVQLLSNAFLRHAETPLSYLLMTRREPPRALIEPFRKHGPLECNLGPLPTRATQTLVRNALGPGVDAATLARIVSLAEGNAFFVEELIRAAARGSLESLPDTVIGTVQARLEACSTEARRALRAASVFGDRFDKSALSALLAEDNVASLPATLRELERDELVARVGSSGHGEHEYAFRHALLRDASYALLTDTDRAVAHRLAAVHLEAQIDPEPMVIARHHLLGRRPEQALEWSLKGAARALAANDFEGSLDACSDAERAGPAGESLARLRLAQARALRWLNRAEESRQRAGEASVGLERGSAGWFDAMRHAGLGAANGHDAVALRDALANLRDAVPKDAAAQRERAIALLHVATSALEVVPHAEIAALLEGAPELSTLVATDASVRAWWHGCRALLAHRVGDPALYVVETRKAAAAHAALGDRRVHCLLTMNLGYGLTTLGELEAGETHLREAHRTAREMGIWRTAAYAAHNLGFALHCAGRLDEARIFHQEAIDTADRVQLTPVAAASRAYLAITELGAGNVAAAAQAAEAAVAVAAGSIEPLCRAAHARVLLTEGRLDDATRHAVAAESLLEDDAVEEEVLVRLVLAEVRAATGHPDAKAAARRARDALQRRAETIADAAQRNAFLTRIPHHREAMELDARTGAT